MRRIALCIVVSAASACAEERGIHPALEVPDTPSGYYALTAKLVSQDCYPEAGAPESFTLDGRMEMYPRADLGAGAYYMRFERFPLWTPNFTLVNLERDRTFASEAVAPNFERPETARIAGRVERGVATFAYVQDRPAAVIEGTTLPGCRIEWRMEAVRDTPAHEAVMELVEQDCYEGMDAYAHGFLLTVGPDDGHPGMTRFRFDSGNWWETFAPVRMVDGSFDHRQAGANPYQAETLVFVGSFDDEVLEASYVQDREESPPDVAVHVGYWPKCRIAWSIRSRRI